MIGVMDGGVLGVEGVGGDIVKSGLFLESGVSWGVRAPLW